MQNGRVKSCGCAVWGDLCNVVCSVGWLSSCGCAVWDGLGHVSVLCWMIAVMLLCSVED